MALLSFHSSVTACNSIVVFLSSLLLLKDSSFNDLLPDLDSQLAESVLLVNGNAQRHLKGAHCVVDISLNHIKYRDCICDNPIDLHVLQRECPCQGSVLRVLA